MMVSLENIHKSFGSLKALNGVDFDVPKGEFHALLGPSSAGKTTTLRVICGLEKPDAGSVSLFGRRANDVPIQGRGLAMIFQSFALYPHLNVRENLAYPLRRGGVPSDEIKKKIDQIAEILGIQHRLENLTTQLSGGEQQRVAIGRALISEPRVLLLDEPLTNLDAKLRDAMRVEFKRLHRELGITMLYATPDQLEATTMGDRISVIDDGKIIASGTPAELYGAPPNARVAQLVGSPPVNLVPFERQGTNASSIGFATLGETGPDGSVCAIRPHDLVLSPEDPDFTGKVVLAEALGDVNVVTVEAANRQVRAVLSGVNALRTKVGDTIPLKITKALFLPVGEGVAPLTKQKPT
ncbi:ABC transporter ATP-binding protein [Ruegeria atlantica]|uniref:Maltose/maltodextrin import ATP-binding protein MalK n=1 Tax=Ruegeria atlantica TaxID=81569 RepID=A0A0P1E4Y2_9RHOB|nr:ABC transporter ATP-binding protein [Ruegeria atlantica]CUH42739.1 Maltose/maltodextrin import ATP-binding protein MalK [Ruegeria atlantica]